MFNKKPADDADCPLWRAKCREHRCRWYMQMRLQHPQTADIIEEWGCAVTFLPIIAMKQAQETHQTGAEVSAFRGEVHKANSANSMVGGMFAEVLNRVAIAARGNGTKLISDK